MTQVPVQRNTGPDGDVDVPLSNDLRAAREARRETRTILLGWRLPSLVDTVCLAVSELVTNAIKHGRPPIGLRLRHHNKRVRVDVHDENPTEPGPPRRVDGEATSGRGLAIVAAIADDVGCDQVPNDGKNVYAEFSDDNPESRRPVWPQRPAR